MTVVIQPLAQPQFQPRFPARFTQDFSASIGGTFGGRHGTGRASAAAGKRFGKLAGMVGGKVSGKLAGRLTGKWPFRPAPQPHVPADTSTTGGQGRPVPDAGHAIPVGNPAQAGEVTVRQMVTDILLVGMWGAMIPGLMWLGATFGF